MTADWVVPAGWVIEGETRRCVRFCFAKDTADTWGVFDDVAKVFVDRGFTSRAAASVVATHYNRSVEMGDAIPVAEENR